MAYLVALIRIVLSKQVALYNLFAAIGSMERTIDIIPFKSPLDMINKNISVTWILENILGNIAIFISFGLLFPIIQKDKSKKIIFYGLITSALIEEIQYVFALGSSDIDDLVFNTLGTIIGYVLYKIIRQKSRTDISSIISIIVFVVFLGSVDLGILFVNHTDLFMLSRKETVIENEYLVQNFIDTFPTVGGKFVGIKGNICQYQQFVHDITHHLKVIGELVKENKNSNIILIVQD